MSDAECRRLRLECENALRKWERDNSPKTYAPSSSYYGGWVRLFQYLLD